MLYQRHWVYLEGATKLKINIITLAGPQDFSGWGLQTIKLIEASEDKRILFNWFYLDDNQGEKEFKIHSDYVSLVAVDTKTSVVGRKLRALIFLYKLFINYYSELKYNKIYIPNAYYPAELIVLMAKIFHIPIIIRVCHKELTENTFKSRVRKHIISRYASKIVLLNNDYYKQFRGRFNTVLIVLQ